MRSMFRCLCARSVLRSAFGMNMILGRKEPGLSRGESELLGPPTSIPANPFLWGALKLERHSSSVPDGAKQLDFICLHWSVILYGLSLRRSLDHGTKWLSSTKGKSQRGTQLRAACVNPPSSSGMSASSSVGCLGSAPPHTLHWSHAFNWKAGSPILSGVRHWTKLT